MPSSTRVLAAARAILAEQRSACAAFTQSPQLRQLFRHTSPTARGSIGSHFRHSVDHFKAWHAAVQSIGRAGDVPRAYYEQRQRDTAMEVDPDLAVKEFEKALAGIDALQPGFDRIRGQPMFPLFRVPAEGEGEGDGSGDVEFRSTVERELWFVSHHALHHNAMVYTIAAESSDEAKGVLPQTFGMAPATIDFKMEEAGHV